MKIIRCEKWLKGVILSLIALTMLSCLPSSNVYALESQSSGLLNSVINHELQEENYRIDQLLTIDESSIISIKKFSKIKTTLLNANDKIVEISNNSPLRIDYYLDGSRVETYEKYKLLVTSQFNEINTQNSQTASNDNNFEFANSINDTIIKNTFVLLGTGSKELQQASPYGDVTLYVKISYTTRYDAGGHICSRLDRVYGKLVNVGVTYFRNLGIEALTTGAWEDSSTSRGISNTLSNYGGVSSPSIGTLYYTLSPSSHYYCTGTATGGIAGKVSIEWKHSSTASWYTYSIQIGEGGWGGIF